MGQKKLHAVVYRSRSIEDVWVSFCLEYDIASQGNSSEHALEMLREAVEIHLEDATRDIIEQIDNEVGSEPLIKEFSVRAPSILDE